tara:strand:+ start:3312 stop:3881 length:570 start_codon:yes stop_codon:yes gene_type:complete
MRSMTEDVLQWSEQHLEPKNKHLGNVSVCPYAKQARIKKSYRILECHKHIEYVDTILKCVELAKKPEVQIAIACCDDIKYTVEELSYVIDTLNKVFVPQNIYLMGSHPYDDEEDEPVEFLETNEWEPDNEFVMVLVQKFDELEKASDNLRKTGYYEHWPSDYYEGTVLKRQSYRSYTYARHEKKNETGR